MDRTIVLLAALSAIAAAMAAEPAPRAADGSTNQWAMVQRCTLSPPMGFELAGGTRIELEVRRGPEGGPLLQAHAINTKGTGASGRAAADHAISTKGTGVAGRIAADATDARVAVDCISSRMAMDGVSKDAARVARPTGPTGPGWTCTVGGAPARPVFTISILPPSAPVAGGTARAEWSWGASTPGASIVAHGTAGADHAVVPCTSSDARLATYDLAVGKKA